MASSLPSVGATEEGLPDELSALSLAPAGPSLAAAGDSHEDSMQDATLASLPIEILSLVHSRLLRADPSLRSCLALEATRKHLRSTLRSNTRYKAVVVNTAVQGGSFWAWIAAHGWRVDRLVFQDWELHHSTPQLCIQAGVLQAEAVTIQAAVIDTLDPVCGLLNLAAVDYSSAWSIRMVLSAWSRWLACLLWSMSAWRMLSPSPQAWHHSAACHP
jgi:hypothetical protein